MTSDFLAQMQRLVGLRFPPSAMLTHWEALQDVPPEVLEAAVTRAQRTRAEFPSPVELRQDADQVAHLVLTPTPDEDRGWDIEPVTLGQTPAGTPIRQHRMWVYYCDHCSDQGMRSFWCEGIDAGDCGPFTTTPKDWYLPLACTRTRAHLMHEYVARCQCHDSNPALVRKRDAERKYAAEKQQQKGAR